MNCVDLAQKLIKFPSVTPQGTKCLDFIASYLKQSHFKVNRLPFENVDNIYASHGNGYPHIVFLGHVDVVPEGDNWDFPPYEAVIDNKLLYGRGAVDMKGAIACFLSAIQKINNFPGTISIILTSDEEGPAQHGTIKVLEWMERNNIQPDYAITGEPTCVEYVGDTIKNGRRGSISFDIKVIGTQGHVAYHELARNPITVLVHFLHVLKQMSLDTGTEHFDASNLEIVRINSPNLTNNVIGSEATATINIRFNNLHTFDELHNHLNNTANKVLKNYKQEYKIIINPLPSAEPFLGGDKHWEKIVSDSVKKITKKKVTFSTSGGTSDARFMYKICPTLELGLLNETAHKKNEHVALTDLYLMENIYLEIFNQLSKK